MEYYRLTQGHIKSVDQIISMINILTFEEFIYFLKLYQSILNSTETFLRERDEDDEVSGFGEYEYNPENFAQCIFSREKIYDQLINNGEFRGSFVF